MEFTWKDEDGDKGRVELGVFGAVVPSRDVAATITLWDTKDAVAVFLTRRQLKRLRKRLKQALRAYRAGG